MRLAPLLTELLLHHPEIHQKHLLEASLQWSRSLSEPKVSQAANKSHIPPNRKANQVLRFYSRLKWIILTLELKEKKQAISLPEFTLPAVTLMSVRSIHLKILIFSLNTNKKKNRTEWSGTLKSLQHRKMLYPESCRCCRTGIKSNSIWWCFSVKYKRSLKELWKELVKPTESSVPSPPLPVLHWTAKHSGVDLLW